MSRLAVIQRPPVLLDRKRTLETAVAAVAEAAQGGAKLIVFPEAFTPGYPVWVWRPRPGADMSRQPTILAKAGLAPCSISRARVVAGSSAAASP
jgi:nitrilase